MSNVLHATFTTGITYTCTECNKEIAKDTGAIWVRMSEVMEHPAAMKAWEDSLQDKDPEGSGFTTTNMEELARMPDAVSWRITHYDCGMPEFGTYDIAVHRIDKPMKVIEWTAHLMEKDWLKDTNWDQFLYLVMRLCNHSPSS